MRATAARSAPSLPVTPGPNRSTSSRRTSGSLRSRRCTISSLDLVAAPCRANASSAALLPAPIPPVIATARGRFALVLVGSGCFVGGSRIDLVARVHCLALQGLVRGLALQRLVSGRRRVELRRERCRSRIAEDVLGQVEVRCS